MGEHMSVVMQFVASFCWAIGAGIAGPADTADYLQFFAAVAWCVANLASAWSLGWLGCSAGKDDAEKKNDKEVEVGSSVRRLLSEDEKAEKQNGTVANGV